MKILLFVFLFSISSCATSSKKSNYLYIGMKEADANAILGQPISTSGIGKERYSIYRLRVGFLSYRIFFIKTLNNMIQAFGEKQFLDPSTPMFSQIYKASEKNVPSTTTNQE